MLTKQFYNQMFAHSFNIPVKVVYWDHTEQTYGDGTPELTITFHEEVPLKAVMKNASLALGEAYQKGIIDVTSTVHHRPLQTLLTAAYQSADSFMKNPKLRKFLPKQSHSEKKSKQDIHSHYDIGNDFYRLWLDKTMTYSCAYFDDWHDDLETAQRNKVEHILRKLNPQPGGTF